MNDEEMYKYEYMRLRSMLHANPRSWRLSSSRALIRQGEAKRLNSDVETESEHYLFSQEQDRGCSLRFDDRHMEICEGSGRELYVIS